jgi:arylformamidase
LAESRIIDISTPLDEHTPVYPGDPLFTRTVRSSIGDDGTGYNLSSLAMSAHAGTHLDAPAHFLANGKTIDQIQPGRWLSSAVVIDTEGKKPIYAVDLERQGIRTGDSVLLKANAMRKADTSPDDFSSLSVDAAAYLVSKKINLVGIDALSIENYNDPEWPVHKKLLRNNILILEGLRLQHVAPGRYTLIATPLRITGGDGSPARALLVSK